MTAIRGIGGASRGNDREGNQESDRGRGAGIPIAWPRECRRRTAADRDHGAICDREIAGVFPPMRGMTE